MALDMAEVNIYFYLHLDWIVQCFTSPPTQYRLYGRRSCKRQRIVVMPWWPIRMKQHSLVGQLANHGITLYTCWQKLSVATLSAGSIDTVDNTMLTWNKCSEYSATTFPKNNL